MRKLLLVALLAFAAARGRGAEEPSGCDKFKWNIDHERAVLTAPDGVKHNSGSDVAAMPSTGITLSLVAQADAKLPSPPERAPKDGTMAGFANFKVTPKAGIYTISLSNGAWGDVVQNGQ